MASKDMLFTVALFANSKPEILLCFFPQDFKSCFHFVPRNLLIP